MDPFDHLNSEQLAYIIQFQHPEKIFARMPGIDDATVAAIFGVDLEKYRSIKAGFAQSARRAASELLANPDFAARIDRLPVTLGATVVGVGDSITDDYQSWLEILRHLLELQRPHDGIRVVNAGVSGDTTAQIISRFLAVVDEQPDWIICMAGTNDARMHGLSPTKTLVSIQETAKNLGALRNFAATQTSARWVWMTPAAVIEGWIADDWFLGPLQLRWNNTDLAAIAEVVRQQPDPVVDLHALFGVPAKPEWLLSDGLHPSLGGQQAIARALVEHLTTEVYAPER
jgi:acyl-CoA thioesterase-1